MIKSFDYKVIYKGKASWDLTPGNFYTITLWEESFLFWKRIRVYKHTGNLSATSRSYKSMMDFLNDWELLREVSNE